jgi:hypothetical protein
MDALGPVFASDRLTGSIPTYYGRPAIKASPYGWLVATYIFIGALAAGLQIVVTAAELLGISGSADVSLIGRAIALGGAILGGILLVAELHTKQRFYNMLRIFRPTSPMSIGTYVLIGFGFWSLIAFLGQLFGVAPLGSVCGCLAAATGWWMTSYTAALLSATATPLWAAVPKLLAIRFASSAIATGAAAASLVALGVATGPGLVRAFGNISALASPGVGTWRVGGGHDSPPAYGRQWPIAGDAVGTDLRLRRAFVWQRRTTRALHPDQSLWRGNEYPGACRICLRTLWRISHARSSSPGRL